jgi:hypothetical protein
LVESGDLFFRLWGWSPAILPISAVPPVWHYKQAIGSKWQQLPESLLPRDKRKKEALMLGSFKDKQLHIELRPQCPKCKKEFMLDLRRFLPGKAHSCFACGTVAQFDPDLAEKAQKLMEELESTIQDIYESFSSR